jgi:DNA-binding Lrp family transcriptional regulator
MSGIVNQVIEHLLDTSRAISSTDVAKAAGISRQAAHKQLQRRVEEGVLESSGKARACRYQRAGATPLPLRSRLDVASAGSLFRLSARLLLDEVEAGEVTLDFTGVADIGEEFLEEIFLVWAPAHPRVVLRVAHLPARFAPMLFDLGRRTQLAAAGDKPPPYGSRTAL